jgi:AmpD protein
MQRLRVVPRISRILSPHCSSRPRNTKIDTIVIHCMYDPRPRIKSRRYSIARCLRLLNKYRVSAHYLISRRGRIVRLVEDREMAWHAGKSRMPFVDDRRVSVNRFSIGIELIGAPDDSFTLSQYRALSALIRALTQRHRIRNFVGHNHIAPGRKQDPGPAFRWDHLTTILKRSSISARVPGFA